MTRRPCLPLLFAISLIPSALPVHAQSHAAHAPSARPTGRMELPWHVDLLQGLPRRISLDFRDVFSSGFAFDSIASKLSVKDGVMRTESLQIDGPAARVVMRGEVDLETGFPVETIRALMRKGHSVRYADGPYGGYQAIIGFEYLVTGTWDDPKVDKVSRNDPATGQHAPAVSGAKEEGAGNESASK